MDQEKIIQDLNNRVRLLEEQVTMLMNERNKDLPQEPRKTTMEEIRRYIMGLKVSARETGKKYIVLRSGDIHKDLNLSNAMPSVCNAMRQVMNTGDIVLHTTPSGNSSTIEIQYNL